MEAQSPPLPKDEFNSAVETMRIDGLGASQKTLLDLTQNWEGEIRLVSCWLWNYSKSCETFVTFV